MAPQEASRFPRRQALDGGGLFLFGFIKNPEFQEQLVTPGTVIKTPRNDYLLKEELRSNRLMLARYRIDPGWKDYAGFNGPVLFGSESDISKIPLFEVPKAGILEFWDEDRRINRGEEGQLIYIPISGLFTESFDNTFGAQLDGINPGYVFSTTYRIYTGKNLLGVPYQQTDTMQKLTKSIENMNRLLHLWKQQVPLGRFVFLGHSLGGRIAHELALLHADSTAAVFILDGALKGAGFPLFPSVSQIALARGFAGEAGQELIELGASPKTSDAVDAQILDLRKKGIVYGTWGSTDDSIVTTQFSISKNSEARVAGRDLNLSFAMGAWPYWDGSKSIQKQSACSEENPFGCLQIDLGTQTDDTSAMLRMAGIAADPHAGPLKNKLVREDIQHILSNLFPVSFRETKVPEPTERYSASGRFILGTTKEDEVLQMNQVMRRDYNKDGSVVYYVASKLGSERADEVIVKNGVVVFEKLFVPQLTNPLNIPNYFSSKKNLARVGFYEVIPSSSFENASIYLYSSLGLALVGNPENGGYYQIQSFIPTTIEEYIQQFGENVRLFMQ